MHDIFRVLAQKGAVFAARALVIAGAFFVGSLVSWARRTVLRSLEPTPVDATLSRFRANFLRHAIIVTVEIGVTADWQPDSIRTRRAP
jgi:hypothetical protein